MFDSTVPDGRETPPSDLESRIPTRIISDNALIRLGITQFLERTRFYVPEGIGEMNGSRSGADVSLVIVHSGTDILNSVVTVRREFPESFLVALLDDPSPRSCFDVHRAGANGILHTSCNREVMINSLELVVLGEAVLPGSVIRTAFEAGSFDADLTHSLRPECIQPGDDERATSKLSPRELEILALLKEGASNKLIARDLEVTEATIKVHVKAILRKIGAANRTQAAMWAATHLRTLPPQTA